MRRSAAPSQASFKKFKTSQSLDHSKENCFSSQGNKSFVRSTSDVLENLKNGDDNVPVVGKETSNIPNAENSGKRYFAVVWGKQSTRKHKKWEGDGILVVNERSVVLQDEEGKVICRASGYAAKELDDLDESSNLKVGGKEVEICNEISDSDYNSGKCFMQSQATASGIEIRKSAVKPFVCPSSKLLGQMTKKGPIVRPCQFPIDAPGALVMPRPSAMHQWQFNKKELPVIDVVVDPHLASKLRPHQRDGIVFLYECVMAFRNKAHSGAILADEMGLGKTLQCIALIWTLLKQGPYGGVPVLHKILIVTPSSLVKNWLKEFKRWLGSERISVFGVDQANKVQTFIGSGLHSVLVISYEMFVKSVETLERVSFDLVICDEGHRLKNTSIKTTTTMSSISTKRRIVLTGTPVQNDLQEFFSIVEFCNPGILGSSAKFKKVYEDPIIKASDPEACAETKSLGENRAAELNRLIGLFTLRRTSEVINKYLPPKVEMVVMCKPSSLQVALYQQLLSSRLLKSCLNECRQRNGSTHLVCIAALKKLCNHPALIYDKSLEVDGSEMLDFATETDLLYQDIISSFPTDFEATKFDASHSGKMSVVAKLLSSLHLENDREKIVLVSSYTQTLDILEKFCKDCNYASLRLDGSTPSAQRQSLVDNFNNKFSKHTVFLLSSKAGGVGLNLIGASRILLYDIDWNPATDLQAMARVWRDGQTKKVFIYRLLVAGSIEEKIYQRQIMKQGISGSVVDMKDSSKTQFNLSDLKDIFSFQVDCPSSTHDLLECTCDQSGDAQPSNNIPKQDDVRPCQLRPPSAVKLSKKVSMAELLDWKHYRGPVDCASLEDPLLTAAGNNVTFVFENKS